MSKFYFTYGSDCSQPFNGGWTEVEASNFETAVKLFRIVHKDTTEGFVNCAGMYPEDIFRSTDTFHNGNFGKYCVEKLSISQSILCRDAINITN